MSKPVVLVTGVTGYLGAWVLKKAVECGKYEVRGTTRNANGKRAKQIKELFPQVKLFSCDLLSDEGWDAAFQGVDKLLHTASPFNADPNFDYVTPAVEGTKRVLAFAEKMGVKSVVVTSSLMSIVGGQEVAGRTRKLNQPITEEMWSKLDDTQPNGYGNSKHLAEKEVWEWAKKNESVRVNTVNPGLIVGPSLLDTCGGTLDYWKTFTSGEAFFPIHFMMVDVQDAAELHLAALESQNRKRFIASITIPLLEALEDCAKEFIPMGYTIPTKPLPSDQAPPFFQPLLKGEWDLDNAFEQTQLASGIWRDVKKSCVAMHHKFIQDGHLPKLEGYKAQSSTFPTLNTSLPNLSGVNKSGIENIRAFEQNYSSARALIWDQMRRRNADWYLPPQQPISDGPFYGYSQRFMAYSSFQPFGPFYHQSWY